MKVLSSQLATVEQNLLSKKIPMSYNVLLKVVNDDNDEKMVRKIYIK